MKKKKKSSTMWPYARVAIKYVDHIHCTPCRAIYCRTCTKNVKRSKYWTIHLPDEYEWTLWMVDNKKKKKKSSIRLKLCDRYLEMLCHVNITPEHQTYCKFSGTPAIYGQVFTSSANPPIALKRNKMAVENVQSFPFAGNHIIGKTVVYLPDLT